MSAYHLERLSPTYRCAASIVALLLLLCVTPSAPAEQKSAPQTEKSAMSAKPKIRAITAFINLDRTQYQPPIADAVKMLQYARTVFEPRGVQMQTVPIQTQPSREHLKERTTEHGGVFFRNYDAVAEQKKCRPSIGPAMLNANDSEDQADLLAEILRNTKTLNA